MNRYRYYILLIIALWGIACAEVPKSVNFIKSDSVPDEIITKFEFIQTDNAFKTVKMESPRLFRFLGKNNRLNEIQEFPDGLKMWFYDSTGTVISLLSCKYAIRHMNTKIMEGKDSVIVINTKGEKLKTEHLIWEEKKDLLYSKTDVQITTKDEILSGKGFHSNTTFSDYQIDNLTGIISIDSKDEE